VTYLLDVSLLIALIDENHVHHTAVAEWFQQEGGQSWSTCPLTENGALRVLSSHAYPVKFEKPRQVFEVLLALRRQGHHQFWADDISLLDLLEESPGFSVPSQHVTDIYLLALAARHGNKLATLDRHIPVDKIDGGAAALQLILP
jgi:toxin-antitoxin system PIN domain toxin